jgi:hypothetical protein
MKMMKDEHSLGKGGNGRLEITNLRVRYTVTATGAARVSSIMIDQVASCVVHYTSYVILLVFGGLSGMAGLYSVSQRVDTSGLMMLLFGALFVGAYFVTRRHVVSIGSASASIDVPITGMSTDDVVGIIDTIEEAKAAQIRGA